MENRQMSLWAKTGHAVAGSGGVVLYGVAVHLELLPVPIVVVLLVMQSLIQVVVCVFPQQSKDRLDWWKSLFRFMERRRADR